MRLSQTAASPFECIHALVDAHPAAPWLKDNQRELPGAGASPRIPFMRMR